MLTEEHKRKIAYLSKIRYLDKEIDRLLEESEYWRAKAEKMTSSLSTMPKAVSGSGREDLIIKIIDTENAINEKIDNFIDLKNEIEAIIDGIEDVRLKTILKDRYIMCKTWEEIAYRNNYSWKQIFNLHEKALNLINIT